MAVVLMAYAGRTSVANLVMSIAAHLSFGITFSLCVSGISVALYWWERRLHRQTIQRLTARITSLELKHNPTRTTSGLTPEGLTRQEDE